MEMAFGRDTGYHISRHLADGCGRALHQQLAVDWVVQGAPPGLHFFRIRLNIPARPL